MKRTALVLFGIATLAFGTAGASGCGGGGESTPAPASEPAPAAVSLTKADLVSQGDGLCAEVNAAVGSIQGSTTVAESEKASQIAGLYAGLADRLEKLGTPDDGPAPTEVIAALREFAGQSGSGDPAAFQTAAQEYGFTDCAEGPSAPVATGTASAPGATSGSVPDAGQSQPAPVPAPAPAPTPAPVPAPDAGGVNPGNSGGGAAPPSGGGGAGSGGIGPG